MKIKVTNRATGAEGIETIETAEHMKAYTGKYNHAFNSLVADKAYNTTNFTLQVIEEKKVKKGHNLVALGAETLILSDNEVEIMKNMCNFNYDTEEANCSDNASTLDASFEEISETLGISKSQSYGVVGSLCSKGLLFKDEVTDLGSNVTNTVYMVTDNGVHASFYLKK
jgi:hypothetical protein